MTNSLTRNNTGSVDTAMPQGQYAKSTLFLTACVNMFAKEKKLSLRSAFNYLKRFKAIAFLDDCFEVEITLPKREILNDMTLICQKNGGRIV